MVSSIKTPPRTDVPTYHLKCVLRFLDDRSGCAIDNCEIEAVSPNDAIALARLYVSPNPTMELLSAAVSAPTSMLTWSLRGEALPRAIC